MGTGNKGENFESIHIATYVPDYMNGLEIDSNSVPKLRLVAVDSMVEHMADTSVENITNHVMESLDTFN